MKKNITVLIVTVLAFYLTALEPEVIKRADLNSEPGIAENPLGLILADKAEINTESGRSKNWLKGRYPYEEWPGFPVILAGSTMDGNLCVNLDDDLALEMVYQTGNSLTCLDDDGSILPGWPQVLDNPNMSCPSYGDINNDGYQEIVVGTSFYGLEGSIYAFKTDGSLITGFPYSAGGTVRTPSLADMEGDGDMEILFTYNQSGIGYLCVLQGDGSVYPGFPQQLDHVGGAGPSAGDVDQDGDLEIFVPSYQSIYGFDENGNILPGFPFTPGNFEGFSYTAVVLVDLDQDGDRELITSSSLEQPGAGWGRCYVLHHDGTVMDGWPKWINNWTYTPAAVGDLNGDGFFDIVIGDQILSPNPASYLYAWNRFGDPIPGFPVGPIDSINGQPVIADVDGDDYPEIIFDSNVNGEGYQGVNHDGSDLEGFPLEVDGTSFYFTPTIIDMDFDGVLDIVARGNLINTSETSATIWDAYDPYNSESCTVPTYQYNIHRDGFYRPNLPVLGLDTDEIDFGQIEIGSEDTYYLKVNNHGPADLVLGILCPEGFTIDESQAADIVIGPLWYGPLAIVFSPESIQEYEGIMYITSNDPENPLVEINLVGEGISTDNENNQIQPVFNSLKNYPNPFHPFSTVGRSSGTAISFELIRESAVELTIYNTSGQLVIKLLDKVLTAGEYTVDWDGRNKNNRIVGSGVYLYRLSLNRESTVKRMVLLR